VILNKDIKRTENNAELHIDTTRIENVENNAKFLTTQCVWRLCLWGLTPLSTIFQFYFIMTINIRTLSK
jgi:hypothetical protein